jgi:hypothetical protein
MLHARPNLNGNAPSDFSDTGYNLFSAAQKMRAALIEVRELLHLRNYQTTDPDLRVFDVARLESYILATYAMENLGKDLYEAAG